MAVASLRLYETARAQLTPEKRGGLAIVDWKMKCCRAFVEVKGDARASMKVMRIRRELTACAGQRFEVGDVDRRLVALAALDAAVD